MNRRRHNNARYSRHYNRGYAYTLGRREAHWKMNVRQRRMRFLRRILTGREAIILYVIMAMLALALALPVWEGLIPVSSALLVFFPLVLLIYLGQRFGYYVVEALSFFMFS